MIRRRPSRRVPFVVVLAATMLVVPLPVVVAETGDGSQVGGLPGADWTEDVSTGRGAEERAPSPELLLSQVLEAARRYGPGFVDAGLQARSRALDAAAVDAEKAPVLTVSGRAELHPDIRQRIEADVRWEFHENVSLRASVAGASPLPGAASRSDASSAGGLGLMGSSSAGGSALVGASGAGTEGQLTLSYSRKLWPRSDGSVAASIDELEERLAQLNEFETLTNASVDVIHGFYALEQALWAERAAAAERELADMHAALTEDAFAWGQHGLKELQDARHRARQAAVSLRHAVANRTQAAGRLQRLAGDDALANALAGLVDASALGRDSGILEGDSAALDRDSSARERGSAALDKDSSMRARDAAAYDGMMDPSVSLTLRDDLAWTEFIAAMEALLRDFDFSAEGSDAVWIDAFLQFDATYLGATLAEMEARRGLADAKTAGGLRWHAEASYSLPLFGGDSNLQDATGGGNGSKIGGSGPSDAMRHRGQLGAFVVASWQWDQRQRLSVEQAELRLEAAELQLRTVRQKVYDEAVGALRALEDAAFVLDVARTGEEQAAAMLDVVRRRIDMGFAGPLELAEAELDVLRMTAARQEAEGAWHMTWVDVARRLGFPVAPPWQD